MNITKERAAMILELASSDDESMRFYSSDLKLFLEMVIISFPDLRYRFDPLCVKAGLFPPVITFQLELTEDDLYGDK